MKIFYIEIKNSKITNKKKFQSMLGRYLTQEIAKKIYSITNTEITTENKKPKFKNSNLCFNITHSNNIVAIAFDDMPLGLDVEYMKERDFKTLLKRYNINSDNKELFYQFWTQYEAEIKIQSEINQKISFKLKDDYMLSLFSTNNEKDIEIFEIEATKTISETEKPIFDSSFKITKKELSQYTFLNPLDKK